MPRDTDSRSRGRDDRGRGGFQYRERDPDATKKRAEQQGGDFDSIFSDVVKVFTPAEAPNNVRILPPTWPDAEHYGYDIHVHYGIGADNQAYLCLDKMRAEACPICEERARAVKKGDEDYANDLKPSRRVAVYLIDREKEKEGVLLWSMPWTVDRDISKVAQDKRSGEWYNIDNPDEGYDVFFDRDGKGQRTKYTGFQIDRRPSPLGKEEWLDFAVEHPIPDVLVFHDYEHILKVFGGQTRGGNERSTDDRTPSRYDRQREQQRHDDRPQQREAPATQRRAPPPTDYTWEDLHSMDYDALVEVITKERLDIPKPDDSKDDAELADWVAAELKVDAPPPPRRGAPAEESESPRDRMRRMRGDR
jgi:hypothetical protein